LGSFFQPPNGAEVSGLASFLQKAKAHPGVASKRKTKFPENRSQKTPSLRLLRPVFAKSVSFVS